MNPVKLTAFSGSAFVKPEPVTFKAADGTIIHGQLFINRSVPGKRAAVVYMHGGPIRQMLLGFHYSDYYIHCYAFNNFMANQGYAVLSINYRDGVGYGRDFRMAKNQGPRGQVNTKMWWPLPGFCNRCLKWTPIKLVCGVALMADT